MWNQLYLPLAFHPTVCWWITHIFLVFSLSEAAHPVHTNEVPWCEAIADGGSATVTCYFPQHLSSSKLDFSIELLGEHSLNEKPVASCIWTDTTTIQCQSEQGYIFNRNLSNTLKVEIPTATSQHNGRYTCKVISYDGKSSVPCTLNITGVPDAPSKAYVRNATLESVTVCWNGAPDKGEHLSYRIRYRTANSGSRFVYVDVWPPEATCFVIAGLTPGNGYEVSIQAGNKFGWGTYRNLPGIANTSGIDTDVIIVAEDDTFMILFVLVIVLVPPFALVCFYLWYPKRKLWTLWLCAGRVPDTDGQRENKAEESDVKETSNATIGRDRDPEDIYAQCITGRDTEAKTEHSEENDHLLTGNRPNGSLRDGSSKSFEQSTTQRVSDAAIPGENPPLSGR